MNHVVDRHLAQIVTNSYGFDTTELLPPGYVKPMEDTLIQAAAEGIGVYFSSGDNGDETLDVRVPDDRLAGLEPVGDRGRRHQPRRRRRTTRARSRPAGARAPTSCDTTTLACTRDGWLYGVGRRRQPSSSPKPWYQSGARTSAAAACLTSRPSAIRRPGSSSARRRRSPKGRYYDEYRIGGTSLSSPIFAGLMALADQKAGLAHGFANPAFYANPQAFTDVLSVKTAVARRNFVNGVDGTDGTADVLRTFDDYSGSTSQHTGPGWDNVTGLGVPNGIFSP